MNSWICLFLPSSVLKVGTALALILQQAERCQESRPRACHREGRGTMYICPLPSLGLSVYRNWSGWRLRRSLCMHLALTTGNLPRRTLERETCPYHPTALCKHHQWMPDCSLGRGMLLGSSAVIGAGVDRTYSLSWEPGKREGLSRPACISSPAWEEDT